MCGRPYWSIDKTHTTRPCTNDRGRNECRSAKSEPIQGAGTAKAGARPPRPAEEKNVAHGPGPIRYRTLAMLDEASFALRMHRPRTHRRRMDGSFWLARPAGELKSPVRRRPGRCRVASGESHQTRAIVCPAAVVRSKPQAAARSGGCINARFLSLGNRDNLSS
jgi:hypothetical protein